MPPRNLVRAFVVFWWTLGAMLLFGSVSTFLQGRSEAGHLGAHLVLLGGIEGISALLFLIPRTLRLGAIGLLTTILIAVAIHATLGEFRPDLLVYAAGVFFVLVHGPVSIAALQRKP
ncbi:MAG: hypothetical protein ABR582_03835 [Gemmatimonadaceae bacterium]